jgi:NADPH-dependent curcumin reductase CurA
VPVAIGEKMRGGAIGRVLASKSANVKEGDLVHCSIGWTEVSIEDAQTVRVIELPLNAKITDALGVLGK